MLPIKFDPKIHNGIAIDFALMKASSQENPLYTVEDICSFWSLDRDTFEALKQDPEFIRTVRSEMLELKKSGDHIAHESRLILENWLDTIAVSWLHDTDGSLGERIKVVEQVTKLTGLIEKLKAAESAANAAQQPNNGYQPTIMINFGDNLPVSIEKVVN